MTPKEKYDSIRSVIKHIYNDINETALEYFLNGLYERDLSKNELYIDTLQTHNEIGFIAKGLIRGFYIDIRGNEINTRFLKEGNFATHYKAFILQEPSKYLFKAVETTKLLCISYNHIQHCFSYHPDLEKFGRLMAEAIITKMDSRLESQHFDNAQKRYNDFLQEYPDLHNRLSLEQISSYIRITRPSLSRLRSRNS